MKLTAGKKYMFRTHGVVAFVAFEVTPIGGSDVEVAVFQAANGGMRLSIPIARLDDAVRRVISKPAAKTLLGSLAQAAADGSEILDQRLKDFEGTINDGKLEEVAKSFGSLWHRRTKHDLSNGELKAFERMKDVLAIEIGAAFGVSPSDAVQLILEAMPSRITA